MSNYELRHKITEILVVTQFRRWIDEEPKTALQINSQAERAIKYFLDDDVLSPASKKFGPFVRSQVALIMRSIEEEAKQ